MSIALILATALLASPEVQVFASQDGTDRVEVAYEALRDRRNADAIAQLRASPLLDEGDPAALINLGAAYARMGRNEEARASLKAAQSTTVRYDLQLADGSWADSRRAARQAAAALDRHAAFAMR